MAKIVSRKLATRDCWIFSKSFHVFAISKKSELKKKEKVKPKEKKCSLLNVLSVVLKKLKVD